MEPTTPDLLAQAGPYLLALLLLSEALASLPQLKSNSVLQLVKNALSSAAKLLGLRK